MTESQRIDHIEDELETVKQLLISTASYAESANKRIDRLVERQDLTQGQLDNLAVTVQVMGENIQVMGEKVDRFVDKVDTTLDQFNNKIDDFIDNTQARNAVLDGVVLELRDNQLSTNAAVERLERILTQLLKHNE